MVRRLIVAVTGASGAVYAKRILEVLRESNVEVHLIVSRAAETIIRQELDVGKDYLERLASRSYGEDEVDAPPASGSFKVDGMVIVPCSMKTIAGIASGYADNLILRAADVTMKEGRTLVLVPRETPLNAIHLRNMLELARLGVVILPAMPAFYHKPKRVEDLVDFVVGKILDVLGVEHGLFRRWGGHSDPPNNESRRA